MWRWRASIWAGVLVTGGLGCGVDFGTAAGDGGAAHGGAGVGGDVGGGDVGGAGGSYPLDLVNRGLLVRYFMDHGDMGVADGALIDAGPHGVDLPLTPAGNVTWLALASGRGLRWQQAESAGMAATAIAATVLNELDGASALTVEVVMGPVSSSPNNGARIFHVGADPNGELALSMTDNHAPELRIAGISVATWNSDLAAGRFVWHAVVDLAEPIDPLRFHRDGVLQATTLLAVPPAQLSIASDQPFVIGNRITGDRAPSGDIFYFAIYDRVLTAAEIAANVARLAATDDALDRN